PAPPQPTGSSPGSNPFRPGSESSNPFATPDRSTQGYQPTGADFNPYQAPSAAGVGFDASPPVKKPFVPTAVQLGDIFNHAWFIYKQQLGMLIVSILIWYFSGIAFQLATQMVTSVTVAAFNGGGNRGAGAGGGAEALVVMILMGQFF